MNTCPHKNVTYTPDPSGNNDPFYGCTDCGKELTREERIRHNNEHTIETCGLVTELEDTNKVRVTIKPVAYARGYYTEGVHKKEVWTAYVEYRIGYSFPRGLMGNVTVQTPDCHESYLFRLNTSDAHSTAKEALEALKKEIESMNLTFDIESATIVWDHSKK